MQILARMRTSANAAVNFNFGIGGRLYNSSGSIAGYSCAYASNVARSRIHLLPDRTTLATFDPDNADPTVYRWMLFDLDGTTIRVKNWAGDPVDDMPSAWGASTTDSTHSAGGAGLYSLDRTANRDLWVAALGVGTNGDPAPTGPVSAGPEVPTNLIVAETTATSVRWTWS